VLIAGSKRTASSPRGLVHTWLCLRVAFEAFQRSHCGGHITLILRRLAQQCTLQTWSATLLTHWPSSDMRTIELTNERASSTSHRTHRCGRCVVADVAADRAKPGCQERDASTESRHVHADREEGGRRCAGQLVKVTALLTFTTRSLPLTHTHRSTR
jgi:hypothetical protein